jgi:hypothetical protein
MTQGTRFGVAANILVLGMLEQYTLNGTSINWCCEYV